MPFPPLPANHREVVCGPTSVCFCTLPPTTSPQLTLSFFLFFLKSSPNCTFKSPRIPDPSRRFLIFFSLFVQSPPRFFVIRLVRIGPRRVSLFVHFLATFILMEISFRGFTVLEINHLLFPPLLVVMEEYPGYCQPPPQTFTLPKEGNYLKPHPPPPSCRVSNFFRSVPLPQVIPREVLVCSVPRNVSCTPPFFF